MKLTHYNLEIIISDPDEPDTKINFKVERCTRESLLDKPGIRKVAEMFEELVEEQVV